jgi:AcrR family transcriptional regulator
MRDIASDCGIKASSLYSHFASKAEMLLLLLDPVTSGIRAAQARALAGNAEGLVKLQRMIREVLAVCVRYPSEMTILHYSWPQIREESGLSPVVAHTTETFAAWRGVVETGIRDGSIRADVDPATIARVTP